MTAASRLDLVLVNPGSRARIYQSLGRTLTAVENPVWAGLIAAFVRRRGFSVEIVDAEAEDLPPDQAAERVAALDPRLGSCPTAREMATLLRLVWTDRAAAPEACDTLRRSMSRQLVRNRLESGFPTSVRVAAKSGALMGVVRNEVGVVTLPSGQSYAVAVFTRALPDRSTDDRTVNTAIGRVARLAVDGLRASD